MNIYLVRRFKIDAPFKIPLAVCLDLITASTGTSSLKPTTIFFEDFLNL